MTREVRGLRWARACARPGCIPVGRPRGVKAKGLVYERQVAGAVPGAIHGQWYEFEDANGPGWCQVDLMFPHPGGLPAFVLLECKLTWTPEAFRQLRGLYIPVVEAASGHHALGLQVCRNLVPGLTSVVVGNLERGVQIALTGREVCWHWLGAPIRPRSPARARPHRKGLDRAAALL